jgi:gamma-glutamylaminecyclotransferase
MADNFPLIHGKRIGGQGKRNEWMKKERKQVAMNDNSIFVYGTLMSGERNNRFLQSAQFLCRATTMPCFDLLDLGPYPAMVENGRTAAHGEVYMVDDETLAQVDQLEGHPHFYLRTRITLANELEVWTYLLHPRGPTRGVRIVSGDWKIRESGWLQLDESNLIN